MRYVLVLVMLFMTAICYAGVEGEVIDYDLDAKGSIRVWTQYKVDGVEVGSKYPKKDGKYVYCTRYHALNFLGMTGAEIKIRVLEDVDTHTKSLIQQKCIKEANKNIKLKDVVGSTVSAQSATMVINGKIYTFNTSGSITE